MKSFKINSKNSNIENFRIKVHYQSYQNVSAGIPASGNVPVLSMPQEIKPKARMHWGQLGQLL
jgi:hypothetical protein